MSSPKILLVLGAGKNISQGLSRHFIGAGYKVALASRSAATPARLDTEGRLQIRADLARPDDVGAAFRAVREAFGAPPRVVVFNAAGMTPPPQADDLFSLPAAAVEADLGLMVGAAWVAAQEATRGWKEGSIEGGRFIYTGNALNQIVLPVAAMVTLGVGKSASAYWVQLADALYKPKGHRFFYADLRNEEGGAFGSGPDAEAHGKVYLQLAGDKVEDVPSNVIFTASKGITKF